LPATKILKKIICYNEKKKKRKTILIEKLKIFGIRRKPSFRIRQSEKSYLRWGFWQVKDNCSVLLFNICIPFRKIKSQRSKESTRAWEYSRKPGKKESWVGVKLWD
jgi:hypothetical protein